jgi:hypothetical protein
VTGGSAGRGGNGGAGRLERRARSLLRAYPMGYRADRGEEILGTLLEATPPGRGWPPARDVASVLAGGLRARRTANLRQAAADSLRLAAMLGITLYLCGLLSQELSLLRLPGWSSGPNGWKMLLPCVPLAGTLAAAWSGRRWPATVSAAAAGAALTYLVFSRLSLPGGDDAGAVESSLASLTVPLLSLAALAALTGSAHRPARSWRCLPCLPVGVTVLLLIAGRLQLGPAAHALAWLGSWAVPLESPYSPLAAIMVGVSVCWLVTDFRPLLGVAASLYLTQLATLLASPAVPGVNWTAFIEMNAPVAVVVSLARLIRRGARTSPPTAS